MGLVNRQADNFLFRIQTDSKKGTFFIEERSNAIFSSWKRVYVCGITLKTLEFTEYSDAVHWIEHEVCKRIGLVIQNTHFRD